MNEKDIENRDYADHHADDDADLNRLEDQFDIGKADEDETSQPNKTKWIIATVIVGLLVLGGLAWFMTRKPADQDKVEKKVESEHTENETGKEVKLDPESVESAGITIETVTQRPAISRLYVTGAVELNPEKTEMASPLVGGRIEKVFAGVGDYVNQGAILATVSSPELAELHGKMNEAKTRLTLAERNYARVQKAENRASIIQAKARLDEADATLKRTKKLIELGAGAGKDLIAAETAYTTAKSDYDFQSNIGLNKEIQEAFAEVQTAKVDYEHIQNQLRVLGVSEGSLTVDDHRTSTAIVAVRSPLSGVVTERKFNAGAGIAASTPIFAISNLSTVYVIANVPESNVNRLVVGSAAEIRSESIGTINGRVTYIDPRLDETSRTARVRLEVPNVNGKLRAGTFIEVGFYTGTNEATGQELMVPSSAIQRDGERNIVFIPKTNEAGAFEVREIEIGGEIDGYTSVKSGLALGDKVVTKGSFVLKTQLQKGELGEE